MKGGKMSQETKRERYQKALGRRTKESYDRREDTGRFKSFLTDTTPDGTDVTFWRPKPGEHTVDIIPYIAGASDPSKTPKGDPTYVLDVFVHRSIGPTQDAVICPATNYGEPCPICEYQSKLREDEEVDDDKIKSLYPSRRCVYNVLVHDTKEEAEKGIQVWECAHYFMERHLIRLAKRGKKGKSTAVGGVATFADPWEGSQIFFEIMAKGDKRSYEGHELVERDYDLEEYLDDAVCLDELIIDYSYQEIKEKLFAGLAADDFDPEEQEEGEASEAVEEEEGEGEESVDPNECPHGYAFGEDYDCAEECAECVNAEGCEAEHKEIRKKREAARKKKAKGKNKKKGGRKK